MRSLYRLVLALIVLFFNYTSFRYVIQLRQASGQKIEKESFNLPGEGGHLRTEKSIAEYAREEARTAKDSKRISNYSLSHSNSTFRPVYGMGKSSYPKTGDQASSFHSSLSPMGYAPTGGRLPTDGLPHYPDPKTWPKIDNGTCIGKSSEPAFEWQKRAPHAILLGAMKGGTHALSEYLWEHPLVAKPKQGIHEMHFFDGRKFSRDASGIPQKRNQLAYAQRMQVKYPDFFEATEPMYAIHDSPRYLLWSDRIPDAILCVTPWAKLMAVLRDPVERAISHYRFQDQARRRKNIPMVDWETWVNDDLRLLRRAGVLQDWTKVDFGKFSGSEEELQAWKTYLRHASSQMILGRGLYAIQIEQYFAAMDRARKPRSELLVIRSEELRSNTQKVFDRVLNFLDLPPHHLGDMSARHETRSNVTEIPGHLRAELEELFAPYNQRLSKLLGWGDVWEY